MGEGENKKPGASAAASDKAAAADDLLSKLFDLGDEKPSAPASIDLFGGPTRVGSSIEDQTDITSGKNFDDAFSPAPDAALDPKESLNELLGDESGDQTVFEGTGKTPSIPAPIVTNVAEDVPAAQNPDPKTFDFGANLFSDMNSGTQAKLPDDKINFFASALNEAKPEDFNAEPVSSESGPLEKTSVLSSAELPPQEEEPVVELEAMAENIPSEKTIILESAPEVAAAPTPSAKPVQASAAKAPVVDPIEAALASFAEGKSDFAIPSQASVPISSAVAGDKSVETPEWDEFAQAADPVSQNLDAAKQEISSADFAEVFSAGPAAVPAQASFAKKLQDKIFSKDLKKWAAVAASIVVGLGVLSLGVYRVKSDAGLLGVRMEGFSFIKAYRPPTTDEKQAFERVFAESLAVRQSDDPVKIEKSYTDLQGVLAKDERNIDAIALSMEHAARLMVWYGVASDWSRRFDEAQQKLRFVEGKSEQTFFHPAIDRAKGFKALAVNDFAGGVREMEINLGRYTTAEDETLLLLSELAYRSGNKEQAEKWYARITDKEKPRTKYVGALIAGNSEILEKLAQEKYLPAQIAVLSGRMPKDKSEAAERLKEIETLMEVSKPYPTLTLLVRSYRGDVLAVAGENVKAREDWKVIVERFPKDHALWMKLAASYEEDALWDDAVEAYRSADKAGGLNEALMLRYVRLLRQRTKVVDALTLIERAISTYQKSALFFYEKGKVQLSVYQEDPAKESFKKALAIDPQLEVASLGLAELAMNRKEWADAEAAFKKIPDSGEHYSEALEGLGRIHLAKRQWKEAEQYFAKAVRANPKLESSYYALVKIQLKDERDEEALALVKKGLEVLPRSPILKVAMARILQFQRNYDEALAVLEPVRKSYEHVLDVPFATADILIDKGDYGEAWKIIGTLVARELRDPEIPYLKAKAFFADAPSSVAVGSNEAAFRLMDNAVRQDPSNDRYRILTSRLAFRLQDKLIAYEQLDQVLKTGPRNSDALVLQGDIQMDSGEYEKASKSYQEGIKWTRFRSPIYKKLAESFKLIGQASLAIKYYQKVTQERPNDAEAFFELGKLYNDASRFVGALSAFKKAVALNPRLSEAYYLMGFVQKEMGDRSGAIRSFEKYLALEPKSSESATVKDEVYFLKNGSQN